jgi:hypothetical protein
MIRRAREELVEDLRQGASLAAVTIGETGAVSFDELRGRGLVGTKRD